MRLAPFDLGERVISLTKPLMSGTDVRRLQQHLKTLGLLEGRVDGVFGGETRRAVIRFQRKAGLKGTGHVEPRTVELLAKLVTDPHWSQLRGGPARSAAAAAPLRPPVKMLWRKPVSAPARLYTTRDMLAARFAGSVAVYDKATAARRWKLKLPGEAFMLCDSTRIFFIEGAKQSCRSVAGRQVYEVETGHQCTLSPLLAHGRIIVPGERVIACFDAVDGSKCWVYRSRGPLSAPAAEGSGVVVQPAAFKTVYGLDMETGRPVWIKRLRETVNQVPAVSGDGVFLVTGAPRIYRLALDNGEEVWEVRAKAGVRSGCVFGRGYAFLDDENRLIFISDDGGTEAQIQLDAEPFTGPVATPGLVWLGFADGLKAYDRRGKVVWHGLKGKPVDDFIIDGFNVYVSTKDFIYCFTQPV